MRAPGTFVRPEVTEWMLFWTPALGHTEKLLSQMSWGHHYPHSVTVTRRLSHCTYYVPPTALSASHGLPPSATSQVPVMSVLLLFPFHR